MPRTIRPLDIMSAVAAAWASDTGCLSAPSMTAVPKRTFEVRTARAERVVKGSSLGLAVRLSPNQTESSPACSASSAINNTSSISSGWLPSIKRPLVGNKTPILGFRGVSSITLSHFNDWGSKSGPESRLKFLASD